MPTDAVAETGRGERFADAERGAAMRQKPPGAEPGVGIFANRPA